MTLLHHVFLIPAFVQEEQRLSITLGKEQWQNHTIDLWFLLRCAINHLVHRPLENKVLRPSLVSVVQ